MNKLQFYGREEKRREERVKKTVNICSINKCCVFSIRWQHLYVKTSVYYEAVYKANQKSVTLNIIT